LFKKGRGEKTPPNVVGMVCGGLGRRGRWIVRGILFS